MATYNFELNNRPTKRGTYVVLLRITENKKHKRIKTTVELHSPKSWNPKMQEVRKSDPEFKVLNETLKSIKADAIKVAADIEERGKGITSSNVASEIKAGKTVFSFIAFADEYAKRTLESGDYRTYTKYITFLNKIKLYINGVKPKNVLAIPRNKMDEYLLNLKKDLLFNDITLSFLNKFKTYLKNTPNSKRPELTLHQNTISKQFDVFKSLYNKGVLELKEEGLEIKYNPFADFDCPTVDTNKEKLTWDEIESIKSLELEQDTLLWHTRNCFLFAFYCADMRVGDLIQLRGVNIIYSNDS